MMNTVPIILALLAKGLATSAMAQTNPSVARHWMEAAPPVPDFQVPTSKARWERQRKPVRAQLWELLGDLPPRPKRLAVQTVKREDRGDFMLEKFQFDNGAGATVPGYLLLPKNVSAKSPAILYCHWHGGQYEIGKEEIFRTHAPPVAAGPALVKHGYAVLAIDAYCFGERNGQGPGGPKRHFPQAWLAVANVAVVGNQQHNPGEPMHWAREQSKDQMNSAFRHLFDYGTGEELDTDNQPHLAKVIWRLMAQLQLDLERKEDEQYE